MKCPKCKSENVSVQFVTKSAKTYKRGCLGGIGRLMLIFFTLGTWLVVSKRKSKTNMKNQKEAVCQNCGYSWKV